MNTMNDISEMPADVLSKEEKDSLEEMCKGKNCKQIRHMSNHLSNIANNLDDHARESVTYDDFKKADKRGESSQSY